MNTHFEVFASYNILQYLSDFIHVLIFVTVSKCRKSPKLTNIVIKTRFTDANTEGCETAPTRRSPGRIFKTHQEMLCWDINPDARPDFKIICEVLDRSRRFWAQVSPIHRQI